jgi:hypothetical protein
VRLSRVALLAVCFAILVLASCAASPVLAARAHFYAGVSFGGTGAVAGEAGTLSLGSAATRFSPGSGVAVNDSSHDIYVADTGNLRVDEFSSTGGHGPYLFVRAWGWGVATGAPELQVCTTTCVKGLSGEAPGEFVSPVYVAVDNDPSSPSHGDVYVGDTGDALVTKFDDEGHLIKTWGNNGENAAHERVEPNGQLNGSPKELFNGGFASILLSGIAVNNSGTLYVVEANSQLFSFQENGTWQSTCVAPLASKTKVGGITTNSSGALYVMDAFGQTFIVTPACTSPGAVTSTAARATGLAADTFDDSVYIDENAERLEDIPPGCMPSARGCAASQVFGEAQLSDASGVAVDPQVGTVYVANGGTNQIAVFPLSIEAVTGAATGVTAHDATVHAAVNPAGSELTRCLFEYGETENYGSSVPCEETLPSIGKGNSLVEVQVKVNNLNGGRAYHFRLRATNGVGGVYSEDRTLSTLPTAQIESVSAEETTATSGLLAARVNPEGLRAHYHFEYGPCPTAAECSTSPYPFTAPEADAEIASGSLPVPVQQHIEGLSDGTTYHFRIVVADANGLATPSPEGTFVHEPASPACSRARPAIDTPLPDCRAYELVTPIAKDGALIDNGGFLTRPAIAEDGGRVLSKSIQCFEAPQSCVGVRQTEGEPFSFARTEGGWLTEPMAPPASAGNTMLRYNAETGVVLYALAGVPPAREQFYAREPGGALVAIGPLGEQPGVQVGTVAASRLITTSDLSRVVYQVRQLWPSLEGGSSGDTVYEYSGRGQSAPVLVGVTGAAGSTSLIGVCGMEIGGPSGGEHNSYGSVSSDGRMVLFTVHRCKTGGTGENAGVAVPADKLYARVEGGHGMTTAFLSGRAGAGQCDSKCQSQPPGDASFQGASTDGSHVFFTSTQQLTSGASEDKRNGDSAATPGCDRTAPDSSGCNLYEVECPSDCEDPAQRNVIDVSAGDTSGLGPQVQGVVAIPSDGSDIYFVARGVLTEEPNSRQQQPAPGGENLYVYRSRGEGRGLSFIATLQHADNHQWVESGGIGSANVTPDGRYLVFTSHRGLTPDAPGQIGPQQVYRYDSQTKALTRISIGAQGFNDNGNAATADARITAASNGFESDGADRANPTMSNNGQLVFFQSPTGLTPGARNDHPVTGNPNVLAENVYEWEAAGTRPSSDAPGCDQPAGCMRLISDGRDLTEGSNAHKNTSAVELLGVDATGSNVFFWTSDQLVKGDTDSQIDLYDARVDGGFPEPSTEPPCGELATCHGPIPPEPSFGPLPSTAFSGRGNAEPGHEESTPPPKLTPAQQLSRALKSCRKKRPGRTRAACERLARAHYKAALLVAALRACRKKPQPTRAACERRARARLGRSAQLHRGRQ